MEYTKDPKQSQQLKKKNKARGIIISDSYRTVEIKTVCYWHKNRYIDQWNRTKCPEISPQLHGQLINKKGGKNMQWEKDHLFNSFQKTGQLHVKQ